MPEKKSQHYVPRSYLKRFSSDPKKRRISLYNLDSQQYVDGNASIKHEACEDNFYGSKEIEEAFGFIEGQTGVIISEMISGNTHPNYGSDEHKLILAFIVTLHARTPSSVEEITEALQKMTQLLANKDPNIQKQLERVMLGDHFFVQMTLSSVVKLIPITFDLGCKLLINNTPIPFITSDHPVVLYNRFFETKKTWGSNTGLSSKGLQILLPISPIHQIMCFDQDIYKVGGAYHKPVLINDLKDIENLNSFQYLNAKTNLYFNNNITEIYIKSIIEQHIAYRRSDKSTVGESEGFMNGRKLPGSIMHSSRIDIRCNLELSFVELTKHAIKFKLGNKAVYLRDEKRTKLVREFAALMDRGVLRPSDFDSFFNERY